MATGADDPQPPPSIAPSVPAKPSTLEQVRDIMLEAARQDQATNEIFARLLATVQQIDQNLRTLIIRLGQEGVISLKKDEALALGVKPKAIAKVIVE